MMARLELPALMASKPCRERDLVLALIAARILDPRPKLATTRSWAATTLADTFGVALADEQDCYAAMDWLLTRQDRIQKKLAARHLKAEGLVLYDLSSSYFEGTTCPLARRGYSRDGKRGTLQVNYGLMTDDRGCPVAVTVHEGNAADPTTLMPEIARVRDAFGITQFVMVGGPRHDQWCRHRHPPGPRRHRLDHGPEEGLHPRARGRQDSAARSFR